MRTLRPQSMLTIGLIAVLTLGTSQAPAAEFPLKDGDVWVMAGDSITAQHLHSNFFEAFCFARYPDLKFAFRNAGIGGHDVPQTLARFDYDIAPWEPTVISVELGMNDQFIRGGVTPEVYIANMGRLTERIRAAGARPVFFAASPINNGDTQARLGKNQRLHEYATALKAFSAKEKAPFADQFHLLIDAWGKNKPREIVAEHLAALRQASQDDDLTGVEHLRAFLAAQDRSSVRPVSLQGADAIHPGPPGQLMMAAVLLRELGASGAVSSATLDASGKLVKATGCQVDGIRIEGGKLAFDRLDERLPFPIPEEARAVLAIDPTIRDLSQYMLQVTGLPPGKYLLSVNDVSATTLTAQELAAGVNLTALNPAADQRIVNPITAQGHAILNAVSAKSALVSQWRNLAHRVHAGDTAADLKERMATLTRQVEEADAKIRAAARPQKLRFELAPVR
ncbi:MAG: hypothetical protein K2R98_05605 [Gemmataceae bacterium]|nr:hypothetical protein [Gemmataceae bacterium]